MELEDSNSQVKCACAMGIYWLNGPCPNSRAPGTQITLCNWKVPITDNPKIPLLLPTYFTKIRTEKGNFSRSILSKSQSQWS